MSARDRNLANLNPSATRPVTLPGLVVPSTGNKSVDRFMQQVATHLTVREGAANPFDKFVTKRDLVNFGVVNARQVVAPPSAPSPVAQGVGVHTTNGIMDVDAFAESMRSTKLWRDIFAGPDSPNRFADFPEKVRQELLTDIARVDGSVDAFVVQTQESISSAEQSFAQQITRVRASVARAAAGVRQVKFAQANDNRAVAAQVDTVSARLDDFDGGGSSVEVSMEAIADRATGLEAQWVLKVNAGGAFAAIGVGASSPTAGPSDSHIIFVADNFAFVHPDDVIGTGPGEVDPTNPGATRIPFGIDSDDVIYLNGAVRINAGGTSLNDLAAVTGIYVSFTSEFWKVDSVGTAVNTSIDLTANFTAGLSGTVDWSSSGTSTAAPTAGTTNTWTIYAADQPDDAVTYTATFVDGGVTYTDSVTIVRLRDGTTALVGSLTNETHTVPASTTGVVSDYTGAGGTFKVFQGTTDVTTSCTFAIQTNSDSLTASIGASTGIYAVTGSGSWADASNVTTITFRATYGSLTRDKIFTLTKALKGTTGLAGTDAQLLDLTADGFAFIFKDATAATSTGTITFTANLQNVVGTATFAATAYNAAGSSLGSITLGGSGNTRTLTAAQFTNSGAWATHIVVVTATLGSLSDTMTVYRGDGGSDAMQGYLSNETATVPADSTGVVSSFSGATTAVQVYRGITDDTANWTFSRADTNITTTINGGAGPVSSTSSITLACTAMAADTGYCDVTASRSGYPNIVKRFVVTKSKAGLDGSPGSPGSPGARGTLTGYGAKYGLYLSGVSDNADPWSSTSTNAYRANRVISNLVNGTALTTDLTTTTLNKIGDIVYLTDNPQTTTQARYWSGAAWAKLGVQITGNLLVSGTVTADFLSSATDIIVTGQGKFDGITSDGSKSYAILANSIGNSNGGIKGIAGSSAAGVYGTSSFVGAAGITAENTNASGIALNVVGKMQINSTANVANLNASYLNGKIASNSSGDIALSNGTKCTNLNADLLDGHDTSYFLASGLGQVSMKNDIIQDAATKFQYSTDGVSYTNIWLKRHDW